NHRKAAQMLLVVTVFWGVSFPVMRAIWLLQVNLLPDLNSWFTTSATVAIRFGGAALILLAFSWRTLGRITRLEVWQGIGLGFFSGGGILLQMDGLTRTSASTSAFLTQTYCVMLPMVVA